jgi:sterol desaturase/sphingolipid hydroxylase (fatty acid hydroxylase superfamily)
VSRIAAESLSAPARASRSAYPLVIVGGMLVFGALDRVGLSALLAAYVAVAIGAVAITVLESRHPYRPSWRTTPTHAVNDITFMVMVQILLPTLLALGVVLWAEGTADRWGWNLEALWPRSWPVAAQAALMLVVGDGMRYWLHRLSHRSRLLWRFHAVHHSPHRLNWLNVSRFHPLDKAAQFVLDSLPFVAVGVGSDVLAIYFVFYALNGFLQHSNCNVRLGWLNHIVAGPELHRWHHSMVVSESNTNYGNNLIIWDRMFGTRFLPDERDVGHLGLVNRDYPTSFVASIGAPFHAGLDRTPP